jgi:hypothetical protein
VRLRYTDPLNPVPDIRENVLFLARVSGEREAIPERRIRVVAAGTDWWKKQRLWTI